MEKIPSLCLSLASDIGEDHIACETIRKIASILSMNRSEVTRKEDRDYITNAFDTFSYLLTQSKKDINKCIIESMISIPQSVFNEASASLPLLANAILSDIVVSQINDKKLILQLVKHIASSSLSNSLLLAAILQSCKNLIVGQYVKLDDLYELFTVFLLWNSSILLEYRSIIISVIDSYSSTSHKPADWSSLQIQLNNRMLQNYGQVLSGQSPVRSRIPSANSSFVYETSFSPDKPSSLPLYILFAIILLSLCGLLYVISIYSPSQTFQTFQTFQTSQAVEYTNYDSFHYYQEVHETRPQAEKVVIREEENAFVIEDQVVEEEIVSEETVEFSEEAIVSENVIDVQFANEGYSTTLFSLFLPLLILVGIYFWKVYSSHSEPINQPFSTPIKPKANGIPPITPYPDSINFSSRRQPYLNHM